MRWTLLLALLASFSEGPSVSAQTGGATPAYSRHRQSPSAYQYYPPSRQPQRHAAPAFSGGTFQRPYPYHLDYYKKQYGGSYEPYFGNLYGPPSVVLGAPYGYYGAPYRAYGQAPGVDITPAAPVMVCPHCQQPIYWGAPSVEAAATPTNP